MAIPYTNPYYSQLYLGDQDAFDNGPVPLPPCYDAYSIGPDLSQTGTSVRWISQQYNITAYDNSKCTLIKDENDYFYYIVAYYTSSTYRVRVNVYDAENDINNVYVVPPAAQLTTANLGPIDEWIWFMRKKSDTEMDFIVRGHIDRGIPASDAYVFHHYTWTIGDESTGLVYVTGWSYLLSGAGTSQCLTLHGPLLIDILYLNPVAQAKTYNLNDSSTTTTTILDRTGKQSSAYGIYHAGAYFHCVALYSTIDSTGDCPQEFGSIREDVRQACSLTYEGIAFNLSGGTSSYGDQLDAVSGHDCYFAVPEVSAGDYIGIEPQSGKVYIYLTYHRGYSPAPCPDEPYIISWPDEPESADDISGVFQLDVTNPGWVGTPTTTSISPISGGGGHAAGVVGPERYVLPSRSDPSCIYGQSIIHWPDLTETANGAFVPYEERTGVDDWTFGGGQRNDNTPILVSIVEQGSEVPISYMHNVWKDLNGITYLNQTTDMGITDWRFYPIQGFMGKWPVHHGNGDYAGRWAIFGPNISITRGPNWQVV